MIVDPAGWFLRVPGVRETGPYNPHFVLDVGLAYLAAGGALALLAWRPQWWPAALAASAFLGLHAALHLVEIGLGHSHQPGFDLALVVLPAALALGVSWPRQGERHA